MSLFDVYASDVRASPTAKEYVDFFFCRRLPPPFASSSFSVLSRGVDSLNLLDFLDVCFKLFLCCNLLGMAYRRTACKPLAALTWGLLSRQRYFPPTAPRELQTLSTLQPECRKSRAMIMLSIQGQHTELETAFTMLFGSHCCNLVLSFLEGFLIEWFHFFFLPGRLLSLGMYSSASASSAV